MCTWNILWICLLHGIQLVLSTSEDIKLSSTTCSRYLEVKKGITYLVKWDGRKLPTGCRLKFINSKTNTYRLTVNPNVYEVHDCDFVLSFEYRGKIQSKYGCRSNIKKDRFNTIQYLYMFFRAGRRSSSKIEIEVTIAFNGDDEFSLLEILIAIPIIVVIVICTAAVKNGCNVCEFICQCIAKCPEGAAYCLNSCDCDCRYDCDCDGRNPDRQESVVTRQPTPEPETESMPSRSLSMDISLSDLNDVDDPLAELPPPSTRLLAITLPSDHEKPPPSYEECMNTNEPPPLYQTTT